MSNISHSLTRRRLLRGLALAGGAAVLSGCVSALPATGTMPGRFVQRELTSTGRRYAYQVFVPAAQVPRPLPVVLFLHGSGERGDDGEKQIHAGLGPYVQAHAADFPALVVFPQSPDGESWEGDTATMALATLDAATAEFDGDRSRTSLTGMSRGGYGTWSLALREPTRFAALVPVCGGITPPGSRPDLDTLFVESTRAARDPFAEAARRLRDIPSWIFHGALDDVVPPEQSRRMHAALRDAGADVRYTEFPDANHNSWDAAYRTEALWPWLFAQKR